MIHVCYSDFLWTGLLFECLRTGRKSWAEWITIIIIQRAKQWGYTPAFGMQMIGQPEVGSSRPTGVKPHLLHPSATSTLLLLPTRPQRRLWTPVRRRGSNGYERTTWSMITVLTPRGTPRGCPQNANEPSTQLHSTPLFDCIDTILFYYIHSFILFIHTETQMYVKYVTGDQLFWYCYTKVTDSFFWFWFPFVGSTLSILRLSWQSETLKSGWEILILEMTPCSTPMSYREQTETLKSGWENFKLSPGSILMSHRGDTETLNSGWEILIFKITPCSTPLSYRA